MKATLLVALPLSWSAAGSLGLTISTLLECLWWETVTEELILCSSAGLTCSYNVIERFIVSIV